MNGSNAIKFALPAAALGILSLGLAPSSAFASSTVTANMAVSATVVATCVVSTTAMAFGNYTAVVNDATSTVLVTCTNTTPYTVGLNAGLGTGATMTSRSMMAGAVLLNYSLFSDTARTANFSTTASLTGNGSSQTTTVYGRVAAGQYVAPGSYSDTIVATVTY